MSNDYDLVEVSRGVSVRVDYCTFTVHCDYSALDFYRSMLGSVLGEVLLQPYQQRMYREVYANEFVRVYSKPIQLDKLGKEHFCIEIKGLGCSCLTPDFFNNLHALIVSGIQINFTRLDLAMDNVPFTVPQFKDAVYEGVSKGEIKLHAKRESFTYIENAYQLQDNGVMGCHTFYIGSRTSGRFVRVYDQHGFTRFETEYKDEWANKVALSIFSESYKGWRDLYKGLIKAYIDFRSMRPWWDAFLEDVEQSDIRVYSARALGLERLKRWFTKQVAPSLFAYIAVCGVDDLLSLAAKGEKRGVVKYKAIMEMSDSTFQEEKELFYESIL